MRNSFNPSLQIPHLIAFHKALTQQLVQAAQRLQQRKQNQLRGGFISWLAAQAR